MAERDVVHIAARYAKIPFLIVVSCLFICVSFISGAAELPDNSYLESLEMVDIEIVPMFRKTTLYYEAEIPESKTTVDVNAIAEDPLAQVTIDGNDSLAPGVNTIRVTVVAQDNSQMVYEITAHKEGEAQSADASLARLSVVDYSITPYFDRNTTQYKVEVAHTVDNLQIIAVPNNPQARVNIEGNESFVSGENQVIVRVESEDGEAQQTYTIVVNKLEEPDDSGYRRDLAQRAVINYLPWAIGVLAALGVSVYIVSRQKKRGSPDA